MYEFLANNIAYILIALFVCFMALAMYVSIKVK